MNLKHFDESSQSQAGQDFKGRSESSSDAFSQATSQVREDIERIVEGFDFQGVSRRVEEFGKKNPVGLAMTALVLGMAVGLLMRKKSESQDELKKRTSLTPVA